MNKRQILNRILAPPNKVHKSYWAVEFKLLNNLLEKFPDKQFWEEANIDKVNSLKLYLSVKQDELKAKYDQFFFQIESGKKQKKLVEKTGEDYHSTDKPKSVKDFLK